MATSWRKKVARKPLVLTAMGAFVPSISHPAIRIPLSSSNKFAPRDASLAAETPSIINMYQHVTIECVSFHQQYPHRTIKL